MDGGRRNMGMLALALNVRIIYKYQSVVAADQLREMVLYEVNFRRYYLVPTESVTVSRTIDLIVGPRPTDLSVHMYHTGIESSSSLLEP